jgi:hypothetical protein
VIEEYFEKFFCCTKISFVRARIRSFRSGKNIYAPRESRRLNFCLRRYISSACNVFCHYIFCYRRFFFWVWVAKPFNLHCMLYEEKTTLSAILFLCLLIIKLLRFENFNHFSSGCEYIYGRKGMYFISTFL